MQDFSGFSLIFIHFPMNIASFSEYRLQIQLALHFLMQIFSGVFGIFTKFALSFSAVFY